MSISVEAEALTSRRLTKHVWRWADVGALLYGEEK